VIHNDTWSTECYVIVIHNDTVNRTSNFIVSDKISTMLLTVVMFIWQCDTDMSLLIRGVVSMTV
jgi:hypothetical protein